MASETIHYQVIASDLIEPTALQLDEEHNAIYALTNYKLSRIDLNKKNTNNVQIVCHHNRRFKGINEDNVDEYSQGESDDEETTRVSDPYEDSEPSTDDDEETIENRRNWRRYGWRYYQLDNPCSILFLEEKNQLIVLNEGVITFLTIDLENERPFVKGASKNVFCYDFDVFSEDGKRVNVQPWSITRTSITDFFIFSLLEGSQLYSLDMRHENVIIEKFLNTGVNNCPYLLFHPQSAQIFVYDSTQIFVLSVDNKTTVKVDFPFVEQGKSISTITIDKTGHIYILSNSTIFKYIYQSQLHFIQCLGKVDMAINSPQMIVNSQGSEFYISDMERGWIYQSKKMATSV